MLHRPIETATEKIYSFVKYELDLLEIMSKLEFSMTLFCHPRPENDFIGSNDVVIARNTTRVRTLYPSLFLYVKKQFL